MNCPYVPSVPLVPSVPSNSLTRAACAAMGTQFEVALWGGQPERLEAAAYAALDEIVRLHHQLSLFDPAADIYEL
ncbi:MAG: FAD:protein FMN transferase, partial [Armatimonadetes bacterium]|nr:FAD:protein FMN transferase [Armatimonadota bacterium]